jgi:di/tricarboxylate transporter
MTAEIALVLAILVVALALLVTGWIRMDLVALLVLSVLAASGLVSPAEALAGFSSPAVVTVWAMFILSEGLTRAGIADRIGRGVLRAAGRSEWRLVGVFMLAAGALSGFMNNIAVAALMLPVAIEVARVSGIAPSRLLMPMAFATMLGGLTTLIGTPPNILASTALREAGFAEFALFDFAPVGVPVLLAGTAFVALLGRRLLPHVDPGRQNLGGRELRAQYGLQERIFALRVAADSVLEARSIAESGLTSAAGLMIIAATRAGRTVALPDSQFALHAGDVLLAQGRLDRFERLRRWSDLAIEREAPMLHEQLLDKSLLYELVIADKSALIGERLRHGEFRERHGAHVLAIRREAQVRRTRLAEWVIAAGDRLLVQCAEKADEGLRKSAEFAAVTNVGEAQVRDDYQLQQRLFVLRVPETSELAGTTIGENGLGDVFDFRLLAIFREGALIEWPDSDEVMLGHDLLLIQGREEDLAVLRGLQQLQRLDAAAPFVEVFERGQLEMVEATLHPRSALPGKRASELALRQKYEVELVAIWRNGRPHRSGLNAMKLQAGDALLIVGPRRRLALLNRDADLIVLNPVSVPMVDTSKAPLAAGLMLFVVGAALLGVLPVAIAAVAGAALMVLSRCLTMEQAYQAIDWRSIFLIAGMLPLGSAMQATGAAQLLADAVVSLLAPYGPWPVIGGLYAVTVAATLVVPTAVLVVVMAPIALSASGALNVAPQAAMMAVAIAAAASVISPVSHPANLLVMGPGGYRFSDYLKLGLPLALLVFVIAALLLPWVWPLR